MVMNEDVKVNKEEVMNKDVKVNEDVKVKIFLCLFSFPASFSQLQPPRSPFPVPGTYSRTPK